MRKELRRKQSERDTSRPHCEDRTKGELKGISTELFLNQSPELDRVPQSFFELRSLNPNVWAELVMTLGGSEAVQRWRRWEKEYAEYLKPRESIPSTLWRAYRSCAFAKIQGEKHGWKASQAIMEKLWCDAFQQIKDFDKELLGLLATMPYGRSKYARWFSRVEAFVVTQVNWHTATSRRCLGLLAIFSLYPNKFHHGFRVDLLNYELNKQSELVVQELATLSDLEPKQVSIFYQRLKLFRPLGMYWGKQLLQLRSIPKSWKRSRIDITSEKIQDAQIGFRGRQKLKQHGVQFFSASDWCKTPTRKILSSWLEWLSSWSRHRLTDADSGRWRDLLARIDHLSIFSPEIASRWDRWLRNTNNEIAKKLGKPIDLTDPECCDAYHRIQLYRKITKMEGSTSNRLDRVLNVNKRREAERKYLIQAAANRELTPLAQKRLEYIQSRPKIDRRPTKKMRQMLHHAAIAASIKAVGAWIEKHEQRFQARLAIPWLRPLDAEQRAEFIHFLTSLPLASRDTLVKGLQSRADHPFGHRTYGEANKRWIEGFVGRGMQLSEWLAQPIRNSSIKIRDSQSKEQLIRISISLTNDPIDVLWMGRPFHSCLDLRGGLYCASAAANWLDANKQLVVVKNSQGKMIARKLLAISQEDDGLIGYRLYSSVDEASSENELSIQSQVNDYCFALANRVGLKLVDKGTPKSIHGSLWYDDGSEEWGDVGIKADKSPTP